MGIPRALSLACIIACPTSLTAAERLPDLVVAPGATARDLAIARASQAGLGRRRGSVVAMDPRTGRVIAIVKPVYGLLHAYQPCSVFKIVVGVAGLAEGVITPSSRYRCRRGCWVWPGHDSIDLRRALAVSCNPFFQWVGSRLGWPRVREYAARFGLGKPTGINLTGETAGRLPWSVTKSRVGYVSSHAAGIRTTALQLGVLISATVNGGHVLEPRMAAASGFVAKRVWRIPAQVPLDVLADGYYSAVTEGSAFGAFDAGFVAGGKTGTCSGVGWLASFAPVDDPELAIVVFIRNGNGRDASEVGGDIYRLIYGTTSLAAAR